MREMDAHPTGDRLHRDRRVGPVLPHASAFAHRGDHHVADRIAWPGSWGRVRRRLTWPRRSGLWTRRRGRGPLRHPQVAALAGAWSRSSRPWVGSSLDEWAAHGVPPVRSCAPRAPTFLRFRARDSSARSEATTSASVRFRIDCIQSSLAPKRNGWTAQTSCQRHGPPRRVHRPRVSWPSPASTTSSMEMSLGDRDSLYPPSRPALASARPAFASRPRIWGA